MFAYVQNQPINWIDPWGLHGPGYPLPPGAHSCISTGTCHYSESNYHPGDSPFKYWSDFAGGAYDFWRNYRDMRDANTIGADEYFHCMANCEASRRGLGGSDAAELISELRELIDEYIKRDPRWACDQDRAANKQGQQGDPTKPCKDVCKSLRPRGLDPKY